MKANNNRVYFKKNQYPGDMMKKMRNMTGGLASRSKYSVKGGIAGTIVGFIIAASLHKNKLIGATIGAISGVFLGNLYSKVEEKLEILNNYNNDSKSGIPSK